MASNVDVVLQESLRRADRVLDNATPAQLLQWLQQADLDLKRRLSVVAKHAGEVRFTEAHLTAYQRQMELVTRYTKARLLGLTHTQATAAIRLNVIGTVRELKHLERGFTGLTAPLRLDKAAVVGGLVKRTKATLLQQHATSVDRYGQHMLGQFQDIVRRGLMVGASTFQLVDALVGHGGPAGPRVSTRATVDAVGKVVRLKEEDVPEGLFVRRRYWAERIVRTETAHAQNAAKLATITEARNDFGDMGKKILATFDNRTAYDSIAVHGQVRPVDGLFTDGAGRQYLRPPARPNDRETIVPWRLSWPETPYSAPMPPADVAELKAAQEKAPGEKRLQVVRAEKRRLEGALHEDQADAVRRVHQAVASKVVEVSQRAAVGRRVLDFQVAQATAVARQRIARQRAQTTMQRVEVAAQSRAQRFVTARGKAAAAVAVAASSAVARAKAYRQERKAVRATAAQETAQAARSRLVRLSSDVDAAARYVVRLAADDPAAFGVLYDQVVAAGKGLPAKFFATLSRYQVPVLVAFGFSAAAAAAAVQQARAAAP